MNQSLNVNFKAAGAQTSNQDDVVMSVNGLNVHYGDNHAIKNVSFEVRKGEVFAFIGPSGCGKSTAIRALNRMLDHVDIAKVEGEVLLNGENIYDRKIDPVDIRHKIGMVFQSAVPFPHLSIYDNVAYPLKIHGLVRNKQERGDRVEEILKQAGLWGEVNDRLDQSGASLSGGQQQRLCIARALAQEPEVLLMDEPCAALDPIATGVIEELIDQNYTRIFLS